MNAFIILWTMSIPILIVLDLFWLGFIARDFYQNRLAHLLGDVQWLAAGVFYVVFTFGLTYFVSIPTLNSTFDKVLLSGALFGFVTYATYDLTNHATLREWPLTVTLVDIAWGTVLAAGIAALSNVLYHQVA
jgi:uncharacterized membrane protein